MSEENANKRIAKNTIALYFRSFIMMAISLYTSRIVLQVLGVEDFGLYSVVGSVLAIFTFINGVLAVGTSRFITFSLGKEDQKGLSDVFSAAFAMHVVIAAFVVLLIETIGLWYLNHYVTIPEGREFAAHVVFHLSALTCFFTIIQVPYNAVIIAHERMGLYAYVGIAEAVFKLVLPLVLLYGSFGDNLIAYGIIMAGWSIGVICFYCIYCLGHFSETKIHIVNDGKVYKSMLSYSLWDLFGQVAGQLNTQGVILLVNMFFGVTYNAAQSISSRVEMAVNQFVSNFMTATNPQIVKSYAQNDLQRFFQLISEAGKFSYYLFLLLALPVFLECDYILSIWLVEVPPLTSLILRISLAITLSRTIARPIINGVHATGDIKFMNLTGGTVVVATMLPGTYLLFKLGFPFYSYLLLSALSWAIASACEIWSMYRVIKFDVFDYLKRTYGLCLLVTVLSAILPLGVVLLFQPSLVRFISTCFVSCFATIVVILYVGLTKQLRLRLIDYIDNKFHIYIPKMMKR